VTSDQLIPHSTRILLSFLLTATLVSCETLSISAQRRWTNENVAGLEMMLIDPVVVEYFGFGKKGIAIYTLGEKDRTCTRFLPRVAGEF